jgi:hypothetical protein
VAPDVEADPHTPDGLVAAVLADAAADAVPGAGRYGSR